MRVAQLRVLGGAMARVPARRDGVRPPRTPDHGQRRRLLRGPRGPSRARRPGSTSFAARCDQATPAPTSNFLGDEGEARVRDAYPGATWDRLRAIKARYDPTNLFRLNQNIPPAAA